jgi:hypothetical protein
MYDCINYPNFEENIQLFAQNFQKQWHSNFSMFYEFRHRFYIRSNNYN